MADRTWAPEVVDDIWRTWLDEEERWFTRRDKMRGSYDVCRSPERGVAGGDVMASSNSHDGAELALAELMPRACAAACLAVSPLPDALDLIERLATHRAGPHEAAAFLARVREG